MSDQPNSSMGEGAPGSDHVTGAEDHTARASFSRGTLKRHRWDDADEEDHHTRSYEAPHRAASSDDIHGDDLASSHVAAAAVGANATPNMATTRWSSATPRQYGGETPRMGSAGSASALRMHLSASAPSSHVGSATAAGGRMHRGGGGGGLLPTEPSTWRGMNTPIVAPYAEDNLTVTTPQFGQSFMSSMRMSGATPGMTGASVHDGAVGTSSHTPSLFRGFAGASARAGDGTPLMAGTPRLAQELMLSAAAPHDRRGGSVGAGAMTPSITRSNRFGGEAATPMFVGATPAANSMFGPTPNYQFEGTTPAQSHFAATAAPSSHTNTTAMIEAQAKQLEKEWRRRNRRLTADYLDSLLPSAEFFAVVPVPAEYNPPPPDEPNFYELALKSIDPQAFASQSSGYTMRSTNAGAGELAAGGGGACAYDIPESLGEGMPRMRPEEAGVFVELLKYPELGDVPDAHVPSYLLMRHLFRLKNGDAGQRRGATRYLLDKARIFGSRFILQRMFHIWSSLPGTVMDVTHRHHFMEFLLALLARTGVAVRECTTEVVHLTEPLLSASEPLLREDGRQVLTLLTRTVGFAAVFAVIRDDFGHAEGVVRRQTSKVAALIGFADYENSLHGNYASGFASHTNSRQGHPHPDRASSRPDKDAGAGGADHDDGRDDHVGGGGGGNSSESAVLGALRDMSFSPLAVARQTVARTLAELARLHGHSLIALLPDVVAILQRLIRDEKRVRREAAGAIAAAAEATAPYGIDELEGLVDAVTLECERGGVGVSVGSAALAPFLTAFGALVPLMTPYDAQRRTAAMMPTLVQQFSTPDEELQRVLLAVVRRCVGAAGVTGGFIRSTLLEPFFDGFWQRRRVAADRRTGAALIATTVAVSAKLGPADVLHRLAPEMKDENEAYQAMVLQAVRRVVEVACPGSSHSFNYDHPVSSGRSGNDATERDEAMGAAGGGDRKKQRAAALLSASALSDSLVAFVLDGAMAAVRQDELGRRGVALSTLATLCNALGARLKPYLRQIFDLIKRRRESREGAMRAQAAELAARIAHTVSLADGALFLQDLGLSLYERLEDSEAVALMANLRASRAILRELGAARYRPSVALLLKKMTFVIRNKHSGVQQATMAIIGDVANYYEADVEAIHLHQLATRGLFELLDAERRQTRRVCTRTFGLIARTIRPFAIILELVDNFRQDRRTVRNCTAVALAAIAQSCGPFTVIPYLLNEYRVSAGEQVAVIVQHAILKAVRYIFEYMTAATNSSSSNGCEYVYALVPLLERALTETNVPMRRMAVEASRALVMAMASESSMQRAGGDAGLSEGCKSSCRIGDGEEMAGGSGFAALTVHLLNLVHPNIVELLAKNAVHVSEERLKLVTAVVSFYEAARLVLGSGAILNYLLLGLFHPAQKVRDIYRRTYNMIYVASPDNLVPYYPRIENDDTHTFVRYELEVLL